MPDLDRLEAAARDLASALEDQGSCRPGLRDREKPWVYGALTVPEIEAYVRQAAEFAEAEEAVLVLAFLGHGFTPSVGSPHLYFMGKESRQNATITACDVPKIIRDVADHPDIAAAAIIVDTCMAAGAAPDVAQLASGAKVGGQRLSILMSCAVYQEGIDMIASRGLAEILRSGIPGHGGFLQFAQIKPELEKHAPDQDIVALDWDSKQGGAPLWIARNAAWRDHRARLDEYPQLRGLLAQLFGPAETPPERWDASTITAYGARLDDLPVSVARRQAEEILANLDVAEKAKKLLHTWLGAELTTALIHRGLYEVGHPLPPGAVSLGAAVAHLADGHYPPSDRGCQRVMAGFVVALGWAADKDLDVLELRDWARKVDAVEHLNDAIARLRGLDAEAGQPRLVVSLASFTDDWPEEVEAWVLRGGERLGQKAFPCSLRDEASAVRALVSAVRWGRDQAKSAGGRLGRIEVAAREGILLSWYPEDVEIGIKLGVDFDVALRWSEQINPPDDIWRVNDIARGCLEQMTVPVDVPPLAWLSHESSVDRDELKRRLKKGMYRHKAFSLDHPPGDPGLFRLLKAQSAAVLWPRTPGSLSEEGKEQMRRCWYRLPESVREAFRAELRDEVGEVPGSLRTVWDDTAWLDFCDNFTQLELDTRSTG